MVLSTNEARSLDSSIEALDEDVNAALQSADSKESKSKFEKIISSVERAKSKVVTLFETARITVRHYSNTFSILASIASIITDALSSTGVIDMSPLVPMALGATATAARFGGSVMHFSSNCLPYHH